MQSNLVGISELILLEFGKRRNFYANFLLHDLTMMSKLTIETLFYLLLEEI